jgi:hypothetical protein
MKLPKKSKKEMKEEIPLDYESESYPYGLQINFQEDQIKNLPFLKDKKVGDKCMVYAEAVVVSTRINERQSGKKQHNIELQIEKVDIKSVNVKYSKKMSPEEYKKFRKQEDEK